MVHQLINSACQRILFAVTALVVSLTARVVYAGK